MSLRKKLKTDDDDDFAITSVTFKEEEEDSGKEVDIEEELKHKTVLPVEDDSDDIIKFHQPEELKDQAAEKDTEMIRFLDLPLSRQSLKNLHSLGFSTPTPIQRLAIPAIMQGKNVCGTATTGSGKTAAFLLPIIERFSHTIVHSVDDDSDEMDNGDTERPQALVLLPTRELAAQCFKVAERLIVGTNVTAGLLSGGMPISEQKQKLTNGRLDLVIGTPGRILDLATSGELKLERMAVLVLDEADRMLDEGFERELGEIKTRCTFSDKQTLLFSATLGLQDALKWIEPSIHSPSQPEILKVSESSALASNLSQQFVRIRQTDDITRQATLLALLNRVALLSKRVIIFVGRKEHAATLARTLSEFKFKVGALHGDLNQQERNRALASFTQGQVDYLVATDVAARGIDIKAVKAVVNYKMPATFTQYQHRVGRTARAGSTGFSISLIGERDRKVWKECMRHSPLSFSHRLIPPQVIQRYRNYLNSQELECKDSCADGSDLNGSDADEIDSFDSDSEIDSDYDSEIDSEGVEIISNSDE